MIDLLANLRPARLCATMLLVSASLTAHAQVAWPAAKPITLIVPFGAGGSVDLSARLIGQKLSERLKQTVIVTNVAGAGGSIGTEKAVRAEPDGYTLVMGADSPVAIAKLITPASVRYDGIKDLAPVGLVTTAPMILVARPGLAANNLADVIRLAKAQPGKLSYATSGVGTVLQLTMELIKEKNQFFMVHVPYRGGGQIVTDLLGNRIDLAMLISASAVPHIAAGKLKGIAVTSERRLVALPDVPTVAESPGFKGFDMVAWTGLFAPAQTPPAIVEKLNRELMEVLAMDDVRAKLADVGATPGTGSAAEFGRFVQKEHTRYAAIVKAANIKE